MGLMSAYSDQKGSFWNAATPSSGTYKVICAFCNPECPEISIFDGSVWNKVISFIFSQPENIQSPISVTEFGVLMLVKSKHKEYKLQTDYQYYMLYMEEK